ncbi:hypothetical protein FWJ25_04480 [Marinobacter salinexigens]|uniref:Glycosyltransferase RgtA/B/C/D-like domain-containing protein n=1 Tax=Marinobacter salinexigens TaxID=2919747 RepID=A0A5B0VRJ3_9GAMM|nr:hypothetical protein [Marinobacter salinexigens]KAA1176389.1 hypothetical protein FWJ25_04480 [Marinobacter salinexigens]
MTGQAKTVIHFTAFALLMWCALLVLYWPGLAGPFVFDDYSNIVQSQAVIGAEKSISGLLSGAFSGNAGPLKRPIPVASFILTDWIFGDSAQPYKWGNLTVHWLCSVLVAVLSYLILALKYSSSGRTVWAGMIAGILFAVHPLQLTSVLYVVQRMTSMAAVFMVAALICQVIFYRSPVSNIRYRLFLIGGYILFWAMAMFSKENALILPLISLVLHWAIVPDRVKGKDGLYLFSLGCMRIYALLAVLYVIWNISKGDVVFSTRPFSMYERLMTESGVLLFYLKLWLWPDPSAMSLYHDDTVIRSSILDPVVVFSIAAICVILLSALLVKKRLPFFALAVLWFFVGHLIESTFVGLELVHEHRNYFPAVGLFVMMGAGAFWLLENCRRLALLVVCGSFVLVYAAATHSRAIDWHSAESLVLSEVERRPLSPRANLDSAAFFADKMNSEGKASESSEEFKLAKLFYKQASLAPQGGVAGYSHLVILYQDVGLYPASGLLLDLAEKLSEGRQRPYDWRAFVDILICQSEGRCKLTSKDISLLISAAMDNQKLAKVHRAAIAGAASTVALSFSDLEVAIYYSVVAYQHYPEDPQAAVNLAVLLLSSGRGDEMPELFEKINDMVLTENQRQSLDNAKSRTERY